MMVQTFTFISLAVLSLASGYAFMGFWLEATAPVVVGLAWLVGQWHGWGRLDFPALFALVSLAALGVWLGVPTGWMLFGLTVALLAWDTASFERRLQQADHVRAASALQRAHLQQALLAAGLGLLLGILALSLQIDLNLSGAIFLGLLIILALGRFVGAA